MCREDDHCITEWLGYKHKRIACAIKNWMGEEWAYCDNEGNVKHRQAPYFTTSDKDAITLLPVLVERGYRVELEKGLSPNWCFIIFYWQDNQWYTSASMVGKGDTISAAISSAVLKLIKEEP